MVVWKVKMAVFYKIRPSSKLTFPPGAPGSPLWPLKPCIKWNSTSHTSGTKSLMQRFSLLSYWLLVATYWESPEPWIPWWSSFALLTLQYHFQMEHTHLVLTTPRALPLVLAILFNLLTLSPGSPVLPSFPIFPGSPCRSAHWSLSFGLPKHRSWDHATSQQNNCCSVHTGIDSYLLQSSREDLEVLGFPWDPLCPVGGKQKTRQVTVTEAKGMINGHC